MLSGYAAVALSGLAFLISVVSLFYFKIYLKRRTGQERLLSELREEVDNILKTIDETTERDISLIEERERGLKSLLADIEKRLKAYLRELDNRREEENAYAALAPGPRKPSSGRAPADADVSARGSPSGPSAPPDADSGRRSYQDLGKKRYRRVPAESFPAESFPPEASPDSPAGGGFAGAPSIDAVQANPARSRASRPDSPPEDSGPAFPLPRFRVRPDSPADGAPRAAGKEPLPGLPAALPIGERVRELVNAGFDAPLIASRLGISIAEAEFAAALLEREGPR